jgi:trehalose 6-phosphate phosphatase
MAEIRLSAPPAPHSQSALFLDIDGTLLEHQAHPEAVRVDDRLRGLLREVSRRLDGALALITGRTIDMADRLFRPLELPVAGIYGLEMRLRPGEATVAAEEPKALAMVAERLAGRFAHIEGIYFEHKGPVLAIHTRAAPDRMEEVMAAAREALPELGNYRIDAGNVGFEIVPIDVAKASALERFMAIAPFAGRHAVFIGDDTSDESAFDYVNRIGGLSIRVKPRGPTAARAVLPDVAAVHAWIAQVLG